MNAFAQKSQGWSRGKFLVVAAGLFAGQAGLVFLLAERSHPLSIPVVPRISFRALSTPISGEELSKYIFAIDPTVFPSSSPKGFAEQAWSRLPANEVKIPKRTEPPSFLEFAANPLHPNPTPTEPVRPEIPFEITGGGGPSVEIMPSTGAETGRQESFFRIEGELAGNQITLPVVLNNWTNANLLTNSVVQFGVNPAGQVFSARLMSSSGWAAADMRAIAVVSALRFRPNGKRPVELWDRATFYWNTMEPPGTNTPATTAPATNQ